MSRTRSSRSPNAKSSAGDPPFPVINPSQLGGIETSVLDDGPVPMGPIVYLEAGTRLVGTIICRCMPSQVDEFTETPYYDLLPLDDLAESGADLRGWFDQQRRLGYHLSFMLDDEDPSERLENCLRLPADF